MFWVIATVILGIAFWGGIITVTSGSSENKAYGIAAAGTAAVVWLLLSVGLSVHTVAQRQVGIVHNFSGTVTGKVDPGVAWTAPWQHIKKENVGLQREEFELDHTNAAVSKDQQAIFARVTLNFQVEPGNVVDLYKRVGPAWRATLLDSRVLQDFKEVTAGFTAQQITTNREALRARTKARLTNELARYDIRVVDFFVKNLDYTDSYKAAINQKNIQVQQSLQAEAKVAQATAEAQQRVAEAQGEAKAIALKGRALREHPEVLQLEAIDKLNPNASVIICTGTGSGNCPSFLPTPQQK